jgi:hypothetical protein
VTQLVWLTLLLLLVLHEFFMSFIATDVTLID